VRRLSSGGGLGVITHLVLDDQQRVDLLVITWAG
jgi:hypothetical protein